MATPATVNPFNFYPGRDGLPLQNGYLYFGEPFQDPELQPLQAYWDDANTQPAARPIRTINGYPARNGAPAQVFVGAQYSMRVRDSQGREVFYAPNVTAVDLGGGGLDIITASGGQTVVNLTNAAYTPGSNAIDVSLNGLILISGQDYFETGTTRITMASALSAGDQIRAFARSTFGLTQAVLSDWQAEVFDGDGAASQNFTLTRNPGAVANLDISVAGSTLRPLLDYTLSGQVVTITPAPAAGTDNVLIRYGRSLPQDALRGELASTASAADGAGMVGASQDLEYAAGTLGARFNDYICPSDHPFLAVGDGTDEHVKLQLALDAAVAAGKPLMFNRLYTGYLDIPDNATLVAMSWNCGIRLPNAANRAALSSADTTNGNDNVQILGMLIDGNRANQSNLASHGINADGPCTNWRVIGNKIKDTLGNGMQSRGGGVTASSTTATDIIVEGNLWQDVGNVDTGPNGRDGLYFNRTQLFRILNNTIERSGRQGIALEGSGAQAIATRRYIVAHNTIRDSTSGGIDDEANEGGDSLIVSNLIEGGGGVGIRVSGLTGNFLVANNHVTDSGSRGLDIEVRQTSYAANCNVIGNVVNTTVTEGIKVNAAGTTTVALNNVRTAGTIGMYIRSVSGDKGLRIEGNTVNGSGQEGLVMDRPCDGPQILGNTIINAGSAAFPSPAYSIRGSTGTMASPVIANNVAVESRGTPYTTYFFTLSNMDSPIIHGNSVFGTSATGDVNFPTTVPANVIFGPNKWDWARITGAPSSYKAAYNGAAGLGSIAWDADAAPTLTISSNVITPTTRRAFVGAGLIKTITAPIATGGGTITLIPTAAFTTDATGNIAIASTATIGRAMTMTYDSGTTKWYPSY